MCVNKCIYTLNSRDYIKSKHKHVPLDVERCASAAVCAAQTHLYVMYVDFLRRERITTLDACNGRASATRYAHARFHHVLLQPPHTHTHAIRKRTRCVILAG